MEFLTSFPEVGSYSYVSELKSGVLNGSWKAINKETQDFYAIKSISKTAFSCPEDHTKFTAEISSMRQANNRYIAAILDFIDQPSTYHVVMQLPEGESLRDHIQNHGPLSEKCVKEFVAKIQYVLVYLVNELGMKYSILNPDNVFVDDKGHLTCFILQDGHSILSPLIDVTDYCFLPPELLSRNVCHQNSNSWSLGAMVYYALTGKIPFFGTTKEEITQAILTSHIDVGDTLPEDQKLFITRTLVKNQLMRIPLNSIFSTQFMVGIPQELPTANERRKSETAFTHKTYVSLTKTPSACSLSGFNEHPTVGMVHLSYKGAMKHSNSKNKFPGTNFG